MADQLELVREELRLRHEIAVHELRCLAEDDAGPDKIDAKLDECMLIIARRDALERALLHLGVR
jgi:hypothetical protein